MPRYDVVCGSGHEGEVVTRWDDRHAPCPTCGQPTERIWKASAAVRGDECDFYDPNFERRFTSMAEHDRTLKQHGLVRKVRHVGTRGGDRSAYTTRWVGCPTISEEDRRAHWYATEPATAPVTPTRIVIPEPESVFTPDQQRDLARVAAQVGL